jgi:hypothetical protein
MNTIPLSFLLLAITVSSLQAQWNQQTIDNSADVGKSSDIAYDNQGYPHIVYTTLPSKDVKYARWTGDGWSISTIETGFGSNDDVYPSIVIDPSNCIHIVYWDGTNSDQIVYHYINSSGGTTESIIQGSQYVYSSSICLTHNSIWDVFVPHVVWGSLYGLWYATLNPETEAWETSIIDVSMWAGRGGCDIVTNGIGEFFVSYLDYNDYDIRFAYCDGGDWSTFLVDGIDTDISSGTSIALDNNGIPHISYYDQTNGDLKYATVNPLRRSGDASPSSISSQRHKTSSDNQ